MDTQGEMMAPEGNASALDMDSAPPTPNVGSKVALAENSTDITLIPLAGMLVVGLVAMYMGKLPTGMVGAMVLLLPMALLMEKFGNWLPGWKTYLGGAPLILIFGGAALVYFGAIPEYAQEIISSFMRGKYKVAALAGTEFAGKKVPGVAFLDFYICGLIVGAIFGINSKLLLKAGIRYVVPMGACIIACCGLTAAVAELVGYGWKEGIAMIAFPILGGGMGGGVVPMTQVISEGISDAVGKEMISAFVPALAMGNVFAILGAGLLNWMGKKYPSMSGDGQIMKNSNSDAKAQAEEAELPKEELNAQNIIIGLAVSTGLFTVGMILKSLLKMMNENINIHHLALAIVVVFLLKVTNVVPKFIVTACYTWFKFIAKVFTAVILLGIGIAFTNLGDVINAITPIYIILCFAVVIASIVGAGFAGRLVGFNFVESALTAGLCMANMGGTGDVAVLSAAKRMHLMPFARFSTSIGGGIIIILCGVFVKFLYG